MGRELRRVPANWEHPKMENGKYQPLYNEYYGDALNKWLEKHKQWEEGTYPDLLDATTTKEEYPFFAMWDGNPPDVEYYHTRKFTEEELTHIQLYETTSEGTPISPVFKADEFEKLCEWAAEGATTFAQHKATKERWMEMLGNGKVLTQVGNTIYL